MGAGLRPLVPEGREPMKLQVAYCGPFSRSDTWWAGFCIHRDIGSVTVVCLFWMVTYRK